MRISFKNALIAWLLFAVAAFFAELINMGALEALAQATKKVEVKENLFPLVILAKPVGANIRVLNIRPRYQLAMLLEPGRYEVEVSRDGYKTQRRWVELNENHAEHHFYLEKK